ncbi:MAG: signal recognition particle-docking protein FtsY [Anaerolineae bacterium]
MLGRGAGFGAGLTKTRQSFFGKIAGLFKESAITEDTWEELEMLLLQADVGGVTTTKLVDSVRQQVESRGIHSPQEAQKLLKQEMLALLKRVERPYLVGERLLNVVLVVGVNGSGKTTSIGKLAKYHRDKGQKVVLCAADTFRAAAIDQLKVWGERVGVPVIAPQPGADPGAVVYDAIRASQSRDATTLIIDTAGRLHTKYNLMQELRKLVGVAQKQVHLAPHETLLVLDATNGQNALLQAKAFTEIVGVTGVVLAKLDSSAKGGIVFAVATELGLPIYFAATGESINDWAPFDAERFVDALFAEGD